MSKSNYLENKVLDHVLGTSSFTMPSQVYVSLHTGDPGETGANEVTGGSYARQSCDFNAASGGSATNSTALSFAGMPSATVTHIGIWDAATSGNFLYGGDVTDKVIGSGNTATIAAGQITVSED